MNLIVEFLEPSTDKPLVTIKGAGVVPIPGDIWFDSYTGKTYRVVQRAFFFRDKAIIQLNKPNTPDLVCQCILVKEDVAGAN